MKNVLLDGKNIRPIPIFLLLLIPCAMRGYITVSERESREKSRAATRRMVALTNLMIFEKKHWEDADGDNAIAYCDEAIKKSPGYDFLYNRRGDAFRKNQQYDEAIADYNEAIRLNRESDSPLRSRAELYVQLSEYENALADYNRLRRIVGREKFSFLDRAEVYLELKMYNEAFFDYREAIRNDPYEDGIYPRSGRLERDFQDQRYIAAVAYFSNLIRLDPDCVNAYANRSIAYSLQGKTSKAAADHAKAVELNNKLLNAQS